MIRKPIVLTLVFFSMAVAAALDGCQPTCDSLPTESLAQVRIVNAVSNSALLLVYVDGRLFDSAWYDVSAQKYFSANPNHIFGYRTIYLSNGLPLRAGQHHVVAIDPSTRDSVVWDGVLYDNRQSLIIVGKLNGSPAQAPRALYLNDVLREQATSTFARFIHAVPDMGGPLDTAGLDVYFADTIKKSFGAAHPDLRIHFGHISHQNPDGTTSDNGTGLSADDYIQFPAHIPGLLIMPIGDTNLNDAILSTSYAALTTGILATIVIRGEIHPEGNEPNASTLILEDGQTAQGGASFELRSFGARIVNAVRFDSLSLLISGSSDLIRGTPRSPGYEQPFPTQEKVTDILKDSVSDYMALGVVPAPTYFEFWFGPSPNPNDTAFRFVMFTPPPNLRFSFIAIDTIPHNTGKAGIDSMILLDSTTAPPDPTMGRVRVVNTSADYTANFTLGGTLFSMKQRDVRFMDVPITTHSFVVTDGNSNSATVSFDLTHDQPITIFFMPSDLSHPIPFSVSTP
ncbi:MAG TPA: hypothetical protein VFD13_06030 [Candidatus Kapabacteria bacterium]|nr:hypothetical protein [Candidatus Kapabacteria bacterium]